MAGGRGSVQKNLLVGLEVFWLCIRNSGEQVKGRYIVREEVSSILIVENSKRCVEAKL